MAVYGVTSDYLEHSAIKPVAGEIFQSNDLTVKNPAQEVQEEQEEQENNNIQDSILESGEDNPDQTEEEIISALIKKEIVVLGENTSLEEIDISDLNFEELDLEEFETVNQNKIKQVSIEHLEKKQAVVNRAMLEILNISEDQAVGSEFEVSFEVIGNLLENPEEKIKSLPTTYKIVGVTPDQKTPLFYVPFVNLRSLGVANFSQIKVITKNKEILSSVRSKIESLGYSTSSVVDTVNQINGLFKIVRFILALLGMVALSVASLGMFNTLTISLLERTREVGLMKSMGMKSYEVKELFLVESLLMGLFGGVIGLLLGYILGEFAGWILSAFSLAKGVGTLDISHIPLIFILIIISLSLFVGIVTGIYPAQRAKRISALNALRYE
jgi:ABC-type antimicrobial peptide transport system permease subunit